MIIHGDAKALEWCAVSYLSQDKVAIDEIIAGFDSHSDNQQRFRLPSRLIAKKFVFRLIYGGSAYAYSMDADFDGVGFNVEDWQETIDRFYAKYVGIKEYHNQLVYEAMTTGKVVNPNGRFFPFEKYRHEKTGEMRWPRTKILNYPVQGFGHDLMSITRVSLKNKLKAAGIPHKLLLTVHDSIDVDTPIDYVNHVAALFYETFKDISANYEKLFGLKFNIPMTVELKVGKDLKNLVDFNEVT